MGAPQKLNSTVFGSPEGQTHFDRDHFISRNTRRRGRSRCLTSLFFCRSVFDIGDCRLGNFNLCAFPATALRVTPNCSPICEMDKPESHNFCNFSRRSSVQLVSSAISHPHLIPETLLNPLTFKFQYEIFISHFFSHMRQ